MTIGADPLGGASVDYWAAIAERHGLDLTVVNPLVDPTWRFMTLDWDGKIRMDCSSPDAMASLIQRMAAGSEGGSAPYAIATGNDADSDRHGIVTPDAGLMNPNHFLAVAIEYLYGARSGWSAQAAVGKTLVSSSMIDRVTADLGRRLLEVPVGFKWFVPGLLDGSVGFGGEESAGASFLRRDGSVWTTDKDGMLLALLASEILAVTGRSPSEHYADLVSRHGDPAYARVDAPASREEKAKLARLSPDDVTATELAGEPITGPAHDGAGQRRGHRRPEGHHRVGLVRGPALRHRGRVQDLRRVLPRPRPPGPGAGRGPRGRGRGAEGLTSGLDGRRAEAPRRRPRRPTAAPRPTSAGPSAAARPAGRPGRDRSAPRPPGGRPGWPGARARTRRRTSPEPVALRWSPGRADRR